MTLTEIFITITAFLVIVIALSVTYLIKLIVNAGKPEPHPDEPYACNGGVEAGEQFKDGTVAE